MKKTAIALIMVILILPLGAQRPDKRVYYFYADNCSACRQAQTFYRKPDGLKDGGTWTYNGITFVAYRIVDANNRTIGKNIDKLNRMCADIAKKKGESRFVYFRRDVYEYYKNKGIPYFRKEEKYSRKDEPFPTPVFVIGERVVLGFSQELVQQALSAAK